MKGLSLLRHNSYPHLKCFPPSNQAKTKIPGTSTYIYRSCNAKGPPEFADDILNYPKWIILFPVFLLNTTPPPTQTQQQSPGASDKHFLTTTKHNLVSKNNYKQKQALLLLGKLQWVSSIIKLFLIHLETSLEHSRNTLENGETPLKHPLNFLFHETFIKHPWSIL